jgi:hypothetical protein
MASGSSPTVSGRLPLSQRVARPWTSDQAARPASRGSKPRRPVGLAGPRPDTGRSHPHARGVLSLGGRARTEKPSRLILLLYLGTISLAVGVVALVIGLLAG